MGGSGQLVDGKFQHSNATRGTDTLRARYRRVQPRPFVFGHRARRPDQHRIDEVREPSEFKSTAAV